MNMELYKVIEKTSYFKVNDVEQLKNLVDNIEGATLLENARGEFAIAGYADMECVYDMECDCNVDIAEKIQPLLPDGEAVIFMWTANKDLLSIRSEARILTNKQDSSVSLLAIAIEEARRMVGSKDKKFYIEY